MNEWETHEFQQWAGILRLHKFNVKETVRILYPVVAVPPVVTLAPPVVTSDELLVGSLPVEALTSPVVEVPVDPEYSLVKSTN